MRSQSSSSFARATARAAALVLGAASLSACLEWPTEPLDRTTFLVGTCTGAVPERRIEGREVRRGTAGEAPAQCYRGASGPPKTFK